MENPYPYRGAFELLRLKPILVGSSVHSGALRSLFSQGYAPLIEALTSADHVLSGESREIHHEWHGPDSDRNRIEIQFGLVQKAE